MKKTATNSRLLILGALCAVFFVLLSPWVASAAVLKANPVSDTSYEIQAYPNAYAVNQIGVGYETFYSSTTPIGGVQLWFLEPNATTTNNVQVCLFENKGINGYSAFDSWRYYRYTVPSLTNSACVTGKLHTDTNGLTSVSITVPWSADATRYMSLGVTDVSGASPTGYTPLANFIGTQYDYGVTEYSGAYSGGLGQSATSTGSIYFQIYSGTVPSAFNAQRFIPSVSTTTVQQTCGSNLATSSGLVDSVGSAVSYGFCVAGTFLFVPSQDSLQSYNGISTVLPTIIPFSYFYDFSNIINGEQASTSVNFTPLGVDLAATGVASTSPYKSILQAVPTTYLSTTTIMTYVPQSLYDTLFLLMRSAIWITLALHIFNRLRPHHITHA